MAGLLSRDTLTRRTERYEPTGARVLVNGIIAALTVPMHHPRSERVKIYALD